MMPENLSSTDMEQLIQLIRLVHGFDFSQYAPASLKRRVVRILQLQNLSLFELRNLLTNDANYFENFLTEITVNVTEMFRDPSFFQSLRKEVIPYLGSYQHLKVWNAGCSSGEELYSFAILFMEEALYNRAFFYGTDINSIVIDKARAGSYNFRDMKLYSENYKASGGINSLSDYYMANHEAAVINANLKQNTLLSIHNLVSDGVFNEFHIISCRNVLIYFNEALQEKVLKLFFNSLTNFGFLCLGSKERLKGEVARHFKIIDKQNNIYQKIT
jgi:chemotaxis protein methyltransferase CheR